MRQFGIALGCLFLLVMTYALQHFKAIEYGYKIESLKIAARRLVEMNRALRLEEASLRDPERIDLHGAQTGLAVAASGTGDSHGRFDADSGSAGDGEHARRSR